MEPIIRKAYERQRSDFNTIGKSATKQSFKDECDINTILKKYRKSGLLEHVSQYQGKYADLSEPTDYQTALNIVIQATAAFDSLPSNIRKRFANNPGAFLEFADNPDNQEEMIKLGLATRKPSEEVPAEVPPVVVPKEPEPQA